MELSAYSTNKLKETMALWDVPADFADPMYNYLVHGYSPGSCFTAVLANDFLSAVSYSHPSNTINAFKSLAGWIRDSMPKEAYGSYTAVKLWTKLIPEQRRKILEEQYLIYTAKEETWLTIKGEKTQEPVLY
jgi:hypothetical protein